MEDNNIVIVIMGLVIILVGGIMVRAYRDGQKTIDKHNKECQEIMDRHNNKIDKNKGMK